MHVWQNAEVAFNDSRNNLQLATLKFPSQIAGLKNVSRMSADDRKQLHCIWDKGAQADILLREHYNV